MAGESIKNYGSWVDLEANGTSTTSAAYMAADDSEFSLVTHGGSRPHIEFEIEFTLGANASGSPFITIFAQDVNMFGGANDALVPSATNAKKLIATVPVAITTTSAQRHAFSVPFAPTDAAYYIYNGTGQTISTGWKLRARGWSLKAA